VLKYQQEPLKSRAVSWESGIPLSMRNSTRLSSISNWDTLQKLYNCKIVFKSCASVLEISDGGIGVDVLLRNLSKFILQFPFNCKGARKSGREFLRLKADQLIIERCTNTYTCTLICGLFLILTYRNRIYSHIILPVLFVPYSSHIYTVTTIR
jgi:hypothetical protein